MQYLGDYAEDATLNFKFSTHKADGTPIALAGTPAISVYKANGTTQSTAGVTLTTDFDSVTGLNNVLIDLSADAFYAVANDYQVVITTGTVDSVSVVGTVLAHFSIENSYELQTTAAAIADAVLEESLADHKEVANSLAKALFETNQRLNSTKVVVDADKGTIKVYDTNGTDLLFTLTKTATGNVYTIARS